jgi:hypothetical protein
MEGEPAGLQLGASHLIHRAPVQEVDAAASIDEHAREAADMRIGEHNGIQDQSVLPGTRHERRMILAPPRDGRLGPVHEPGLRWHDGAYLGFVLEVVPLVLL